MVVQAPAPALLGQVRVRGVPGQQPVQPLGSGVEVSLPQVAEDVAQRPGQAPESRDVARPQEGDRRGIEGQDLPQRGQHARLGPGARVGRGQSVDQVDGDQDAGVSITI